MENYNRSANISANKTWSSHPVHQPPLHPDPSNQPAAPRAQMIRNHPELRPRYQTQSTPVEEPNMQILSADGDDGMPGASDFVRKLFRMLEDPAFASIVCWGSQRDCFIVKDMTEFTKVILPRLFKHSNFASFVRQLNKYDFHKVKNVDDNAYGEHCWTFRHPKFRADHLDGLEDIKRKSAPARRASTRHSQANHEKSPDSPVNPDGLSDTLALQSQIDQLLQTQHEMKKHIGTLENNYRSVLDSMALFQSNISSQDAILKTLLRQFVDCDQQKPAEALAAKPQLFLDSNFVSEETQRMMSASAYNSDDVARASLQQLTELSQRANRSVPIGPVPPLPTPQFNSNGSQAQVPAVGRPEDLPRLQISPDVDLNPSTQLGSPPLPITTQSPLDWSKHNGLQVLTVGHLLPRSSSGPGSDDMEVEEQVMPSTGYPNSPTSPSTRLRVRRKTYVPGWAVPPRVLLVEDDAVSRKLSSKFLQVLGVTTDIAIDGDAAVKQMCLERYDLVLMDIVMPRLDGVAATSLIRQFDDRTPIISMTSSSCPQDVLNYYSHGMNDILPKPFTRDGLFSMLEKHLIHLKAISQMQQIPRSLQGGDFDRLTEVNDNHTFKPEDQDSSFMPPGPSTPFSISTFIPGMPGLNPIAGLGVADEQQYASMLASMTGDLFSDPSTRLGVKRSAQDDPDAEDHPSKRSRFETVE